MTDVENNQNVTSDRFIILHEELSAMPERELLLKFRSLGFTYYVFEKNYTDLAKYISYLSSSKETDRLIFSRNRDLLDEAMVEIIRLLHNFEASVASLIDHTRNLYNDLYKTKNLFTDYQANVDRTFNKDPLSKFIKELRQFMQHYKIPNISTVMTLRKDEENVTRRFCLTKTDLNQFSSWTDLSRKFINSQNENILILDLITAYKEKVSRFYLWFQERQTKIFEAEIQKFKEKEKEYLTFVLKRSLKSNQSEIERGTPISFEDIFAGILLSRDFNILEESPRDSLEYVSKLIVLLKQRNITLSKETEQEIIELYNKFILSKNEKDLQ